MKQLWISILILAAMLLPAIVYAKWDGTTMRASVPFEFIAGDKKIPAGQVDAEVTSVLGGALWVGNRDANTGTYVIMHRTSADRSRQTTIEFHRYGDSYFLASVAHQGSATAFRAPESKVEESLRRQNAPEIVLVAAK